MSVNTKVNGQLVKSAGLYKASVPIQSGDIYSFEERQVGVWTDGKPLYQKTIDFGTLPNATTKAVSTGFESGAIDVVKMTGFALNPTSDVTLSIPRASSTAADAIDLVVVQSNGYECVRLATASNYSTFTKSYITIQYTKTTDVAGSGEYVPSGDKAVHYSTEEEVIGTWLGKTLYRRVFDLGSDLAILQNSFTTTTIDASSMETLVDAKAIYSTGVTVYNIMANINNGVIRLQADRNDNSISARYIVLEYTKTS